MMKHIITLIIVCQFFYGLACSPSKHLKIDQETNLVLEKSKNYLSSIDLSKTVLNKYSSKKEEEIWVYRNSSHEIVRLSRRITTTPSDKIMDYFFDHNELICTQHFELNRAKVKNGLYVEQKKYFFNNEKTIQALERKLKSKSISESKIQVKLNKISWKNYQPNPYIYQDEMNYLDKIQSLINSK